MTLLGRTGGLWAGVRTGPRSFVKTSCSSTEAVVVLQPLDHSHERDRGNASVVVSLIDPEPIYRDGRMDLRLDKGVSGEYGPTFVHFLAPSPPALRRKLTDDVSCLGFCVCCLTNCPTTTTSNS